MATFNNLKELEGYLKKVIDDSLDKEIAKYVTDEITVAVSDVVYGAGIPVVYKRRAGNANDYGMKNPVGTGSLADPTQMAHTVQDGVLEVVDNADFKDAETPRDAIDRSKSLAENIEDGYGNKSIWWNKPRPFMESAKEAVSENLKEMMQEALEKRLGKGSVK